MIVFTVGSAAWLACLWIAVRRLRPPRPVDLGAVSTRWLNEQTRETHD